MVAANYIYIYIRSNHRDYFAATIEATIAISVNSVINVNVLTLPDNITHMVVVM